MIDRRVGLSAALFLVLSSAVQAAPDFERDVVPVLVKRCAGCHNGSESRGDLNLTTRQGLLAGGSNGPALVPGKPVESLLLKRIAAGEMPPRERGQSRRLARQEEETLRAWVQAGATWPRDRVLNPYELTTETRGGLDWWSLQPVKRPALPAVKNPQRVANPIDVFVLATLERHGLTMAPPPHPRTLIRRLHFDLVGLPPSAEDVEAFVRDPSPPAYERLVDRLLASPHHGERSARYWLDLVRYAETNGYERDAVKPFAWKYRDWVIRSINADKPYDRFVLEQLAGDELAARTEETVVATSMLRVGTWDDEPNDKLEYKYDRLEDLVHVTSTAFLGLTVKCARCHDHKFDPISQVDYHRMAGIFWPGDLMGNPGGKVLGFDALGWTDVTAQPPPLRLLKKGNPRKPGRVIEPGFLATVSALSRPFTPTASGARTTGRRLQFAGRIVDPRNPLTARVLVNRLWQHHFGQGLVRTPNNFGFKGDRPSHPELLDWLAVEFMERGWSLKHLHRLIVTSAAYRQSSVHPEHVRFAEKDHDNRLLWRMNRRRLDAEALRDAMLATGGQLNPKMAGPGFSPRVGREALEGLSRKGAAWQESPADEQRRRSIYLFTKRSLILPLMTTFDFADTTQPCGRRDVTTVAPQALALLNNEFVHEQSSALAERVRGQAGRERKGQIHLAWRLTFGRSPTQVEMEAALAHLETQARHFKEAQRGQGAGGVMPRGAVLWLRADEGVTADAEGRVAAWADQSSGKHHGKSPSPEARPLLVHKQLNGGPVLRFDGKGRFLQLEGQVLTSQQHTIIAVASDRGGGGSHREIFSNWNRAGNSVTSVFLGTTGTATVRFSDAFPAAGSLRRPGEPFILSAVAGPDDTVVYQDGEVLARKGTPLSKRTLNTPYVVGQQGNIGGEYWNGDIAEIVVFDRALTEDELREVWRSLGRRYGIGTQPPLDPEGMALASLCHVLLNANEFIYVD